MNKPEPLRRRKSDKELEAQLSLGDEEPSLIDQIAERAAERAMTKLTNRVYQEVGKNVITKFIWIVGVLAVALWAWARGKGLIE